MEYKLVEVKVENDLIKSKKKRIKEEVTTLEFPDYTEKDLINFKHESYIKEEVTISDVTDFTENEVANNDQLFCEENNKIKLTTETNSEGEDIDVVSIRKAATTRNDVELDENYLSKCTKCGKRLKDKYSLPKHERLCGLAPFLMCKFCDYKAKESCKLKFHLMRLHKDLKAEEIQKIVDTAKMKEHKVFGTTPKFTNHEKEFNSTNFVNLYCSKCEINFNEKSVIRSMRNRECPQCFEVALIQCLKCDQRYVNRRSMNYHLKSTCQPQECFQCADCDYQSVLKKCLIRHIQRRHVTVAREDYSKCSKCDRVFKYQSSLKLHESLCGKKAHLQCEFCPFRGKRKYSFKRHVLNHILQLKDAGATISDIKIAEDRLKNSNNYLNKPPQDNIKTKSTTEQYQCTKCDGTYKSRRNLQGHQRICGLAPYVKCEFCHHKTRFRCNLKNHLIRRHKDLSAEQMQKTLDAARVKEHKMFGNAPKCITKIDWKPFIKFHCSICDTTFDVVNWRDRKCSQCCKLTLLQCLKCDQRYMNQSSMYSHLRSKCRPKECFKCADCNYTNGFKHRLLQHIKIRHKAVKSKDFEMCGKNAKENNLINCQQESLIKEEVMISDISDLSDNEVSISDNSMLRKHNILFEDNNKMKRTTQENSESEDIDVVSISQAVTTHNDVELDKNSFLKCTKCGDTFKRRISLRNHNRLCGFASFLKCEFCDLKTMYRENLKRHLQTTHKKLKAIEIQEILDRAKTNQQKMLDNEESPI